MDHARSRSHTPDGGRPDASGRPLTRRLLAGVTGVAAALVLLPHPAPAAPAAPPAVPAAGALAAAATPPAGLGQVGPKAEDCSKAKAVLEPNDPGPGRPGDWTAAVSEAGVGGTICFKSGRFTGFTVKPLDGQTWLGRPGTILDGAAPIELADIRQQSPALWYVDGLPTLPAPTYDVLCLQVRPVCHAPDDLYINGARQRRVAVKQDVRAGTYFSEYTDGRHRLYLGTMPYTEVRDPASPNTPPTKVAKNIRILRTPYAFEGSAKNVTVASLVVERYATPTHEYAVGGKIPHSATGWTVRNLEVRFNHGGGIGVRSGREVTRNWVHHNGHQGISGSGGQPKVENNNIEANNTAGYDINRGAAEGGAGKFTLTQPAADKTVGMTYRNNWVHGNLGQGAWFDIGNRGVLIDGNTSEDNEGVGLMYEISHQAWITNNTVRNNGTGSVMLGKEGGKFYAYSAGILVSSSEDVTVQNNTVTVPKTFRNGISILRELVDPKDPDKGYTWVLKETTHGIMVLQGERHELPAGCPEDPEKQPKPGYQKTWECDLVNVKVSNNLIRYESDLVDVKALLPEEMRAFTLDGKGKSGSGLVANGEPERQKGNVFSGNTYQMPNCNTPRWYWVVRNKETDPAKKWYDGVSLTFKQITDLGHEAGSTCGPIKP